MSRGISIKWNIQVGSKRARVTFVILVQQLYSENDLNPFCERNKK